MIKIKLGEIVESEVVLGKLQTALAGNKLAVKTAYKVGKLLKKVTPELQDFYDEKKRLLEKFGKQEMTTGEDGKEVPSGSYKIENPEEFMKYMQELYAIDIELYNVLTFSIDEINAIEDLTSQDAILISPFVDSVVEPEVERKAIKLDI